MHEVVSDFHPAVDVIQQRCSGIIETIVGPYWELLPPSELEKEGYEEGWFDPYIALAFKELPTLEYKAALELASDYLGWYRVSEKASENFEAKLTEKLGWPEQTTPELELKNPEQWCLRELFTDEKAMADSSEHWVAAFEAIFNALAWTAVVAKNPGILLVAED